GAGRLPPVAAGVPGRGAAPTCGWGRPPPLPAARREPVEAPTLPPVETILLSTLVVQGTARATVAREENGHRVEIAAVDGNHRHVQLRLPVDDLQEGATCTVRFRARADAPRRVNLSAQAAEPYWQDNIGLNEAVPLTKDWKPYEYEFQAKDLAAQNVIIFNVGEQTGTVWIADFTLTRSAK